MNIIIDHLVTDELIKWFNCYVKNFTYNDYESQQNIDIKYEHSKRVAEEILRIGRQSGLKEDELRFAEIIALYHDIGRFEQYDRYRTFSDNKSEDHAELGIRILVSQNVLGKLKGELQEIILCSIRYHNRPSLPAEITNDCLLYSRLIRDADKLDIWKIVTDYYHRKNGDRNVTLELELPETPGISQEVYNALMNKKIVDFSNVKNINDIKLLQAGLVYDVNFKTTFEYIKKRRYMESLKNTLPEMKEITEIFDILISYISERCK